MSMLVFLALYPFVGQEAAQQTAIQWSAVP
ncbi:hypothetical protein NS506_01785 [Nocardia seriolae]|uniref:Uncharacterized protein n=1 Tax=Nocardia seriolae TaxID=37332 RepID=A0ABC8ANR3_9NOCA|nr:hypothetical protein NS506_01785 [Nocardia seriolae]